MCFSDAVLVVRLMPMPMMTRDKTQGTKPCTDVLFRHWCRRTKKFYRLLLGCNTQQPANRPPPGPDELRTLIRSDHWWKTKGKDTADPGTGDGVGWGKREKRRGGREEGGVEKKIVSTLLRVEIGSKIPPKATEGPRLSTPQKFVNRS